MSAASLQRTLTARDAYGGVAAPCPVSWRQRLAPARQSPLQGRGSFQPGYPRGGSLPHDFASGDPEFRLNSHG